MGRRGEARRTLNLQSFPLFIAETKLVRTSHFNTVAAIKVHTTDSRFRWRKKNTLVHDQTEGAKYSGFKVVALHAGSLTPNVTSYNTPPANCRRSNEARRGQ